MWAALRIALRFKVHKVDNHSTDNFIQTRINTVKNYCAAIENSYWPNQYDNPDFVNSHYHWLANEIDQQSKDLDVLFIAVSTGGTIAGVSKRMKELNPEIKIIAVDVVGP
ncbi:MAG: pyridoxal-phosphate dependent enzyme [Desulfobacteraceae bacterium]|nr:pyridoxal-phosphate dependent enzyme [Desulfobacteraceae bacterium]